MRAFILTGSRDWQDFGVMAAALRPLAGGLMIHGDARGADAMGAGVWAGSAIAMPAQWNRDGKSAGPIRNEAMLDVLLALNHCGYEVSVQAFSLPQSVGTAHMKRIAEAAGVRVVEHGRTSE